MSNEESKGTSMARAVAPEDIRPGDFVSVLYVIGEHISLFCDDEWRPLEPRRVRWLPRDDTEPMKVVEVCLPFVLVRSANGKHRTLDVRRYRLARVSERFGRKTFKRLGGGAEIE